MEFISLGNRVGLAPLGPHPWVMLIVPLTVASGLPAAGNPQPGPSRRFCCRREGGGKEEAEGWKEWAPFPDTVCRLTPSITGRGVRNQRGSKRGSRNDRGAGEANRIGPADLCGEAKEQGCDGYRQMEKECFTFPQCREMRGPVTPQQLRPGLS